MSNTKVRAGSDAMGTEKIPTLILRFAIPAILTMLVNALYNFTDKIFVGQGVGAVGLAATTVSMPAMNIMVAIATLVGTGGNALLAIKLGEGKKEEAEGILGNSVVLVTLLAVCFTVLGHLFVKPILVAFGADADILLYATTYLRIIISGMLFQSLSSAICNYIRTEGNPTRAMVSSMSGVVVNIVLDALFVMVFKWGIAGAAIATVIAQIVSCCMVMSYFTLGKKSTIRLTKATLRCEKSIALRSMQLGFATFVGQLMGSLVNVLLNNSLKFYAGAAGTVSTSVAISAIGITTGIGSIFVMCIGGLQQAVQPIMGYNYGAKKYDRLRQTVLIGCAMGLTFLLIGYAFIMLFTEQWVLLFGSVENQAAMDYTIYTVRTYNLCMPLIAITQICTNYFVATGQAIKATILSMSRQIFGLIPFMLILPRIFGLNGVVMSFPLADFIVCAVVVGMMIFEWKKLKKLEARLPDAAGG